MKKQHIFLVLLAALAVTQAAQEPIVIPDGEWALYCSGLQPIDEFHVVNNNLVVVCRPDNTATAIPFTATPSPSRTPTRTAAPPTATASATHPASPTASQTALPQPSATRSATPPVQPPSPTSSGNVQPFASAPECLDSNGDGHADVTDNNDFGSRPDNTLYHDIWNERAACHYDHTHHDNPSQADGIFGVAGRDFGQNISYPHMTDNENNMMGHMGYKYYVNLAPQPACAKESFDYFGALNCVSAFRIQYHDVGGSAHMVKRFHSYYLEAQVKKGNIVGYVRTGGWADFGCLHGSYKEFFITLPGIDPSNGGTSYCQSGGQDISQDPYRSASTIADAMASPRFGSDNFWSWTSWDRYGYNKIGMFFYRVLDASGGMDANDPYKEYPICSDFKCKYNNSEHHVYTVMLIIPASLDTNGDGIVNYTGYTDRRGTIVQGCTAPSLDCVPLQIVNAPVGRATWARNLSGLRPAGDPVHENDIYFNGKPSGWIEYHIAP